MKGVHKKENNKVTTNMIRLLNTTNYLVVSFCFFLNDILQFLRVNKRRRKEFVNRSILETQRFQGIDHTGLTLQISEKKFQTKYTGKWESSDKYVLIKNALLCWNENLFRDVSWVRKVIHFLVFLQAIDKGRRESLALPC